MALGKKLLLSIILSLSLTPSWAQLNNAIFHFEPQPLEKRWSSELGMLNYLKNEEYFNGINPGETMLGTQLKGLVKYNLNAFTTMSAGVLLQKDFGDPKVISNIYPLIRLGIRYNKWELNFGTLNANIKHRMIEPMLSYNLPITRPVEYGIQGTFKGNKMFYDGWLDWVNKLDAKTGRQEEIVFGQNLNVDVLKDSGLSIYLPIQGLIYHRGGQGLNTDQHLITRLNSAIGLKVVVDTVFVFESYFLNSLDNSPTPSQPFKGGWANMSNFRFTVKDYHEIALTWWYAQEFVSTMGNPIFNNVNLGYPYANAQSRSLIMLRWNYARPIVGNKLWIDTRVEPYYDLRYNKFEYSFGLFLKYAELF